MTKKIKLKISARLVRKRARRLTNGGGKHCRFCGSAGQSDAIDYKNATLLRNFITERGKILPSRISGCCARHQRHLSREIKKSRSMALLPYSAKFY